MFITTLIFLVLLGIVLFLTFKFFKSILHTAVVGIALIAVLFLLFSFMLAQDVEHVQAGSTFLLRSSGKITTGFGIQGNFTELSKERFDYLVTLHGTDALEKNATKESRIVLMDARSLQDHPERVLRIDGMNFTKGRLLEALIADDARASFAAAIGVDPVFVGLQYDDQQLRARLFGYLAQETLLESGAFSKLYRDESMEIYPQTFALRMARSIPGFFVDRMFDLSFALRKEVPDGSV